jgi:transcriptional regulator with PAS, ATPase and Fis domain
MLSSTEPTSRPRGDSRAALRVIVTYATNEAEIARAMFLVPGMEIGRGAEGVAPLVIDDSEMSRRHAVIEGTREAPTVRDLGSRNGTFVNGFALKDGKPLAHGDVLRLGSTLLEVELVRPEHVALVTSAPSKSERIVGSSLALLEALQLARSIAPLPVPVLLLGETGVGKELFAKEIHDASGRTGPFVPVNCAALPEQVAESELFGHEKGAFTGADRASPGLFGEARGGTLFLDEVGELPAPLQAKLLRALATGEVRRVGATRADAIDVRVVAATNVRLEEAMESGAFRGDLYSRLAGGVVTIPPLRARRGDVLRLARELFLRSAPPRTARGLAEIFSPDVAEALSIHRWRFNVREMEQLMRLLGALGTARIELTHLPPLLRVVFDARTGTTTEVPRADLALVNIASDRAPTRDELLQALAYFGGNVSQTSAFFGKDRRQIYRWAERLGVTLDTSR